MNESWLVEKTMLTSNNEVSFHKWVPELVSGGLQKSRLTLVEKGLIVALYSNYGVSPVGGVGTKYQAAHLMRKDLSMEGKFGIWSAHDMSTHGFVIIGFRPPESVIFIKLTLETSDKWAAEYSLNKCVPLSSHKVPWYTAECRSRGCHYNAVQYSKLMHK